MKACRLLSILTLITNLPINSEVVILESTIISHIDGTFITADIIEFIRMSRQKIADLVQKNNLREFVQKEIEGIYDFNAHNNLTYIKHDFLAITKEFLHHATGAKAIIVRLIEEDCIKRNREDSLLLSWAKTPEGNEEEAFNKDVTSYSTLYSFCVDLINFLNDLMHSCPKAHSKFTERIEKGKKICALLPNLLAQQVLPNTQEFRTAFLKFMKKNHYLDHLTLYEITSEKIGELLLAFSSRKEI